MIPDVPRIHVGRRVAEFIDFLQENASPVFDGVRWLVHGPTERLEELLLYPDSVLVALAAGLIAWWLRSWQFAIFVVFGFLLIDGMNMWTDAMETLALITVAGMIAILFAIPLGVAAAQSRAVSVAARPVLDFMQTMPVFVYLIPAILLFGIGIVPGAVATTAFAIAPGIRLTELGIRQVDHEVIEAAQAFGASKNQILLRVQLPLALPTIMAGINQIVMLALSMVVIVGMVGAAGLGGEVVRSISTLNASLGVEAGLSVVILAIFLDRITEGIGRRVDPARAGA